MRHPNYESEWNILQNQAVFISHLMSPNWPSALTTASTLSHVAAKAYRVVSFDNWLANRRLILPIKRCCLTQLRFEISVQINKQVTSERTGQKLFFYVPKQRACGLILTYTSFDITHRFACFPFWKSSQSRSLGSDNNLSRS